MAPSRKCWLSSYDTNRLAARATHTASFLFPRMSRHDTASTRPPRIAISATMRTNDHRRRVRLNAAYVEAIERAGAVPLVVPPLAAVTHAAAIVDACDGLVLTGGEDIDPGRYDAARDATVEETNPERDATEIALVEAARARACPTFAICRGLQLLNVALGGSLVQDVPSRRPDALDHDPAGPRWARVHEVEIEAGSTLARTLGSTRVRVNSFHHQSADRVAEGLRATAWAPDGIIEGLSMARARRLVGPRGAVASGRARDRAGADARHELVRRVRAPRGGVRGARLTAQLTRRHRHSSFTCRIRRSGVCKVGKNTLSLISLSAMRSTANRAAAPRNNTSMPCSWASR